jgi:(S)-sulfolactate dehydrogenase
MPDVVVTEFMDQSALEPLRKAYGVHVDTGLWNKPAELEELLVDTLALIVRNRTQVSASLLEKAPRLKVVGRLGVGLDNIDTAACRARAVKVCPAVGANAVSVAEYVIGSALVLARLAAYRATPQLIAGGWPREETSSGMEIAGKRLGIVGFGNIGQTVAGRARAIGLTVAAFDDYLPASNAAWRDAARLGLDDLLATSDIVSLHCPLTAETRNLFDAARLARMRRGALLINTARGGIVDEPALAAALRSGHLGGAAIDVFANEPIDMAGGAQFQDVPNLILTPHVAGVTRESNDRISTVTVENVLAALRG